MRMIFALIRRDIVLGLRQGGGDRREGIRNSVQ